MLAYLLFITPRRRHRGELHEVHIDRDVDACFVCLGIACLRGQECEMILCLAGGSHTKISCQQPYQERPSPEERALVVVAA